MSLTANVTNPIKEDPILRKLLQDLESITNKRDFTRWKASFVERFSNYLSTDGETAANERRNAYQQALGRFVKVVQQLEQHIRNGDLSSTERTTVKARKCLAEVHKHLTVVADQTETLIPGTGEQARQMGYTKFHMGAVLIRDGFEEYDRLSLCADIMDRLRQTTCLGKVADKQLLEEMDNYVDKFGMFCDIMADLGLHQAMLRCHKINELPDEPEPELEPETEPEPTPEPEPEPEPEPSESEESIPEPPAKDPTTFDTSFKNDSAGRLEMTTQMEGSGIFDGENSKNFTLNYPGIRPPDGPFIKFMSPEEYQRRKKEREEAARLKRETDAVAYQPVKKIDFKIGAHYHGSANVANCKIEPDLADDYSSGTDSSSSDSSEGRKKKKKTTTKKVVVKKVVKKKVMKKKPKEGGTTEPPKAPPDETPNVKNAKFTPASPQKTTSKAKIVPPSPPVKVVEEASNTVDDDDLTMTTLSPEQGQRSKVPPSALDDADADDDSSASSASSEDITLAHLVDFDGMEGVKGLKKSNH